MVTVTTFERINKELKMNTYEFENEKQLNLFIELCNDSDIIYIVQRNQKSA